MSGQTANNGYYAPEEEQSISLLQMFEIVKRHVLLIVALTVAGFLAGFVYLSTKTPTYSASATAIVRPMTNANSLQELLNNNSTNITTEIEVMSAASTLQSALDSLDLSLYADLDGVPYSQKGLTGAQMSSSGKVSVSVASGTNVVTFTVKDSNPQFCADYANAVVEASSAILRKMSRSSKYSQKELLESQIISTQALLDAADEELAMYRKENGVIQMAHKISLLTKRIASFQLMMEPLGLELEQNGALVSSLYKDSLPSVSYVEGSEAVESAVADYEQAVMELLMYSSMDSARTNVYDLVYVSADISTDAVTNVSTDKNAASSSSIANGVSLKTDPLKSIPMDASVQASNPWGSSRMALIQSMLSSNEEDLYDIVYAMCGAGGEDYAKAVVDYIVAKARLAVLERMESSYSEDFAQYSVLERKLSQLERDVSTYESLMLSFKTSLDNVETMVEAQNFTVVSDATVPTSPESQKRVRTIAIALVLGAGCGVLLAFAIELLDTSVRSEDSIKAILGRTTPSLGWTYYLKDVSRTKADFPALVVRNAPNSVFAEKYRTIANNILNAAPVDAKAFSINSVEDCEGRTSTICNVATFYAMAGKKVVVVDADFNHPAVGSFFGLDASRKGFANVMEGDSQVMDCATQPVDGLPNLHVVPAGTSKGGNRGLMYSQPAFEDAIAQLRDAYDIVLVDFPSLTHCPDFACLSKCLDGYVLNVRAGVEARSSLIGFNEGRGFICATLLGYVFYGVVPQNQSACGNIGFYGAKGCKKGLKGLNGDGLSYSVGRGSYRSLYRKDLKARG